MHALHCHNKGHILHLYFAFIMSSTNLSLCFFQSPSYFFFTLFATSTKPTSVFYLHSHVFKKLLPLFFLSFRRTLWHHHRWVSNGPFVEFQTDVSTGPSLSFKRTLKQGLRQVSDGSLMKSILLTGEPIGYFRAVKNSKIQ